MKQTSKMYCVQCNKTTDHVPYIEDDTIDYNGVMVEFTDKGFICSVCGSQNCTPEQYDEVMQEIRENYELTRHRQYAIMGEDDKEVGIMAWVCDNCHSVWSDAAVEYSEADVAICPSCGDTCIEEDLGDDD